MAPLQFKNKKTALKSLVFLIMVLISGSGCKSSEAGVKTDLAPEPIESSPKPETEPISTPEPTPEPTAEPSPTPTATPEPTPTPDACNDSEYKLIGTWQNVARAEDILVFNDDCTYTTVCSPVPRAYSITDTNETETGGSIVFNVQSQALDPIYCTPINGVYTTTKSGGWSSVGLPESQVEIMFHYRIGAQIYERVE